MNLTPSLREAFAKLTERQVTRSNPKTDKMTRFNSRSHRATSRMGGGRTKERVKQP